MQLSTTRDLCIILTSQNLQFEQTLISIVYQSPYYAHSLFATSLESQNACKQLNMIVITQVSSPPDKHSKKLIITACSTIAPNIYPRMLSSTFLIVVVNWSSLSSHCPCELHLLLLHVFHRLDCACIDSLLRGGLLVVMYLDSCMSLVTVRKRTLLTFSPVSSIISRAAQSSGVSPYSRWPPGSPMVPALWEPLRLPTRKRGFVWDSFEDWSRNATVATRTGGGGETFMTAIAGEETVICVVV